MTGDELRTAMQNIANARTPAAELKATIQLLVHEDELAAALDDRDRLEWLEQTRLTSDATRDLVSYWKWDGKRYGAGLRAAIDSARGKE